MKALGQILTNLHLPTVQHTLTSAPPAFLEETKLATISNALITPIIPLNVRRPSPARRTKSSHSNLFKKLLQHLHLATTTPPHLTQELQSLSSSLNAPPNARRNVSHSLPHSQRFKTSSENKRARHGRAAVDYEKHALHTANQSALLRKLCRATKLLDLCLQWSKGGCGGSYRP